MYADQYAEVVEIIQNRKTFEDFRLIVYSYEWEGWEAYAKIIEKNIFLYFSSEKGDYIYHVDIKFTCEDFINLGYKEVLKKINKEWYQLYTKWIWD